MTGFQIDESIKKFTTTKEYNKLNDSEKIIIAFKELREAIEIKEQLGKNKLIESCIKRNKRRIKKFN